LPPAPVLGGSFPYSFRPGRHNSYNNKFHRVVTPPAAGNSWDSEASAGFSANLEYFTESQRLALPLGAADDFVRNANLLDDSTPEKPVFSKQAPPVPFAPSLSSGKL
jgi:hypothetical protein